MAIFAVCKQFRPRLDTTEPLIYIRGESTMGAKRLMGKTTSGGETTRGETTRGETSWGAKRLGEEMVWGRNVPDSRVGGCGDVYVGWGRGGRLASLCPRRLDLGGYGWFYMWFGDNMAGRCNKNAFVLQVYIDTIWVFRMVWRWFGVFWGGLGC